MSHPVKGIDHCFVLVNDLDAAAAQYSALGFTLSPRGLHSAAKGSANYTIMFPNDYFELLGLLTPTELNAKRRKTLAEQGEGLHAIACRIDSADIAAKELDALGITTQDLNSFERPVPLPGGGTGLAAFSTVAFTSDEVPLGSVFMCEHKTRETVWLPELLTHPNTACGLGAILAISETPEQDAQRFARLWSAGQVVQENGTYTVKTGQNSAPMLLMNRSEMDGLYPGIDLSNTAKGAFTVLQVKVTNINATRACLAAAGITLHDTRSGVAVSPETAAHTVLEFVPV